MTEKRTPAITIVGGLALVWGSLMLALAVFGARGASLVREQLVVGSALVFLNVLWILSGIGLLRGLRWGWWVASVQGLLGVVRHGLAVLVVYGKEPSLEWSSVFGGPSAPHDPVLPFVALFAFTVFVYTDPVRGWCGTRALPAMRALAISGACGLVVAGLLSWLART